jgi:hypothetical protein
MESPMTGLLVNIADAVEEAKKPGASKEPTMLLSYLDSNGGSLDGLAANDRETVLIPVQAAHHNEMMSPAVTE